MKTKIAVLRRRSLWAVAALLLAGLVLVSACASSGDRAAHLGSDGLFVYPSAAKQAHTEGYVVIAFDIDANGRVEAPHVVTSQPLGVFDEAALRYIAGRQYVPALKGGHPSAVMGQHARVNFKLGEADVSP